MLTPVYEFPIEIIERYLDGFGLKEIQERGQGPTILEINLQFKRELLNPSVSRCSWRSGACYNDSRSATRAVG